MKTSILTLLLLLTFSNIYSQSWNTYQKANPTYTFDMPGIATIQDTLNLRMAWLKKDSMTVFQVLEIKNVPLDSENLNFRNALQEVNGDTLMALVGTLATANGAVVVSSQQVNNFSSFNGLEVCMKYNDLISGRVLMVYCRYFFRVNELLTFSVSGAEDDISTLQSYKSQFFNSIILQ